MKLDSFITMRIFALLMILLPALQAEDKQGQVPSGARMSYLDNGVVKVGVDLNHGGAIVYLSRDGGDNVINNFDFGRQVQLSFYSGPVPFTANGQQPAKHWEHLGWNPIQAGDDFDHSSPVLAHENDGKILHVKCQPMQWPLNNVPGDCTFDTWLELEGSVVKVRARLNNARKDHKQYRARSQELPAVYANGMFHRVVTYSGDRPFTGDKVSVVPKSTGKHPWSSWQGTENWAALLDERDQGIGLITPGRVPFTGGFAGRPGPNDTFANSTGYLAGLGQEILDHNITYEYRYEFIIGSLKEIRARAASLRPVSLPVWTFTNSRHGWHYRNSSDQGWPVKGHLRMNLDQKDPKLISPYVLVQAEEAKFLIIEAAFKTSHRTATLFWQRHGEASPGKEDVINFPIDNDEQFRRYIIDLSAAPSYRGGISRLRFDPVPNGKLGDWMKVKSIRFSKQESEL